MLSNSHFCASYFATKKRRTKAVFSVCYRLISQPHPESAGLISPLVRLCLFHSLHNMVALNDTVISDLSFSCRNYIFRAVKRLFLNKDVNATFFARMIQYMP